MLQARSLLAVYHAPRCIAGGECSLRGASRMNLKLRLSEANLNMAGFRLIIGTDDCKVNRHLTRSFQGLTGRSESEASDAGRASSRPYSKLCVHEGTVISFGLVINASTASSGHVSSMERSVNWTQRLEEVGRIVFRVDRAGTGEHHALILRCMLSQDPLSGSVRRVSDTPPSKYGTHSEAPRERLVEIILTVEL